MTPSRSAPAVSPAPVGGSSPLAVAPAAPQSGVQKSVGGINLGCCVEPSSAIWMLITLLGLTLFLVIFFCVLGVTCRWIYKRRMRKKCDALRNKYIQDEKQRRSDEMKAKRLALRPILPYHPRNDNKDALSKLVARQCPSFHQGLQMQPTAAALQPAGSHQAPQPPLVPVVQKAPAKIELEEKKKKTEREKLQRREAMKREPVKTPTVDKKEKKRQTEREAKETEEKTPSQGVSAWSTSTLVSKKTADSPRALWPPSSTALSTPARSLRPPNAYELRGFMKTGRPADEDVSSPQGLIGQPGPPPKGFSHLRVAAIKRDCMPSVSDPTLPRRS